MNELMVREFGSKEVRWSNDDKLNLVDVATEKLKLEIKLCLCKGEQNVIEKVTKDIQLLTNELVKDKDINKYKFKLLYNAIKNKYSYYDCAIYNEIFEFMYRIGFLKEFLSSPMFYPIGMSNGVNFQNEVLKYITIYSKDIEIVKDIKNIGQDAILKYNNDLYVFEIKNSPTNSATKQVKNHCDKLNISKYITLNGEEGNVNNICFDFVRDVSCISSYIYEGLYKEYKKEKQNN